MPDQFKNQCRFQKQRQKTSLPNQPGVFTCLRRSICLLISSRLWCAGGGIALLILSIGLGLTTNLARSANRETDNQTRRDIDLYVTAVRAEQPIKLDGVLDEPAWQNARPITDFVQIQPDEGAPPSLPTEIRLLFDQKYLYFGFTCYDDQIDRLVANEMRRDGKNVHENDNVFILIDGYNDQRSGFFFRINPLGALQDCQVFKSGDSLNFDWDAVWQAQAKVNRTDNGQDNWVAEVRIPFSQLRFKPQDIIEWGLNVGREVARLQEEIIWSPVPKKYGGKAKYRTEDLGRLRGLEEIASSRKFEVLPYLLSGLAQVEDDLKDQKIEPIFELGGDLKYSLTSNLTADLTYNTDFAQVEADREYVNLSRFSLFFPEKRPFFLEGSNFFEFGISGSSLSRSPPLLLFYSRNIGIDQGRMVPIIAGGKLTGKVGSYGLGFLNVMTDQLKEPSEELSIDRTNFSVVRLRKDLLTSSSLGVIATNRQSSADNYNRTGGVDFLYRPSETLTFNGLMATSTDRDQQGQAFYLGGGWRGDKMRASTGYSAIDPDFVPGVGFAERGGGRRLRGELRWAPWVSDMGDWIRPALERIHLREIWSGPETDISFNNEQEVETVNLRYLHWMNFKSGDWIAIDVQNTVDRLEQPFDVHSDHQIPAGEYVYTRFWLTTETAETRIISARISVGHGQYYHGQRSGLNGFLTFKPNGYFSLESSYSLNRVKLPDGSFNANVIGGRLVCSLSTLAYAKLFVQWNSESERLSTNLLLNYIYQPGSDFYLVLNQIYSRAQGQRLVDRAILAKLTYWYQ